MENAISYRFASFKTHLSVFTLALLSQKELRQTYSTAGEEKGHGSFDSMTDIVETGVKLAASRMYDEAATYVKNELIRLQVCLIRCWFAIEPKSLTFISILQNSSALNLNQYLFWMYYVWIIQQNTLAKTSVNF